MTFFVVKQRPVRERYVGSSYGHYYHPMACSGFFLAVAGLVLFSIAVGTHFLYESHNENIGIGMYRVCNYNNNGCSGNIANDCTYSGFGGGGNIFTSSLPSCHTFNAIRILGMIATILAGIAVLFMLCTCCSGYVFYEWVSGICFLSAICGCASFFCRYWL